jgi:L-alanine-DL-glutamate epimerase-like enolase superfamily enzyme
MSVIDRMSLYFVQAPLPAPFSPAWVPGPPRSTLQFYLVRFTTDDGVSGLSAFPAVGRERSGMGDWIANLFLGIDPTDIDLVRERIGVMAVQGVHNGWLEAACWDIAGRLAGRAVCELLGGRVEPVTLYASSGEVKTPAARIDEAWQRHEEGFRTFKIRVHDFDETVDIAQVQAVARAMEGRMRIAVDCNQAFRLTHLGPAPRWDLARAQRFADACAEVGVAWIEEPLHMSRFDDMAALTAHSTRVPIAGGELHCAGLPELRHMVERGCYHIFQPDAVWTGGIADTVEVGRLCRAHGRGFTPHTWSNGFGFGINLQVLLASGFANEHPFEYPLSPPGWTAAVRDVVLATPWHHDGGVLQPPTAPGLGMEIDEAALARFGRCFFRADRVSRHWMPEVLRD